MFGSNNLMWVLVLLLILGNGEEGTCGCSCNTLIWLLLLSRYCGGDSNSSCGCGCGSSVRTSSCGC